MQPASVFLDSSLMLNSFLSTLGVLAAKVEVGNYISILKIIPVLIILLPWGLFLTWVDKDTDKAHLNREWTNLGLTLGLVIAFATFLLMPTFLAGLPVFLLVFLIEAGVYLGIRNSKIGLKDLKQDIRDWFAELRGEKKVDVVAGAVTFFDKKGPMAPPGAEDPRRVGYEAVQTLLTDPLTKNAERIDLTPNEGSTAVKFSVDGFSYPGQSLDRTAAGAAIEFLKPLAGLNIEEKRKPQTGMIKVQLQNKKKEIELSTAGSTAGEFLKIVVEPKKKNSFKIDQLGLPPDQLALLKASIEERTGIVLVCAPRGQGLTSMLYAVVRGHDAFLEHIQTIERSADQDVEGITQNKLAANAPAAEEAKLVGWITSQEPDVVMINQIEDANSPKQLIEFCRNSEKPRRVYVGMRAGSTFDALAMWRKIIGDDELALSQLKMIICGRIMRKLCSACKVGYTPDADQLKKLNMNPATAKQLFQARREPLRDPKGNPIPCEIGRASCRERV